MTNAWDESPFLMSANELDLSEAIRALERLTGTEAVKPETRKAVDATLQALRLELG